VESVTDSRFGVRSMAADLRRVLVRPPSAGGDFVGAGWLGVPDPLALRRQHDAFCTLLGSLGSEVVVAAPADGLVDAVFVYDPAFVTGRGGIVLRSPKPARAGEAAIVGADLEAAGVPVIGRLEGDAHADGGDLLWLDGDTLAAGRTLRTNAEGHRQLAGLLRQESAAVERFDMPYDRGAGSCLHLMSVISPVTADLAVVYEPLAPVPLLEALDERQIRRVRVPDEEYPSLACNVLAVRPGVVIMVEGNPQTRRLLEAEGVEVNTFDGSELCVKGEGGPTCLTRPLLRELARV